jgi:osmoprotectant transport system substrate-binding protein
MPFVRWAVFLTSIMCTSAAALGQPIVVGAKDFTEQLLVAEMSAQLLRERGLEVHAGAGFTTSGVRRMQEAGVVDLYWEYTGTSLTAFNGVRASLDPDEAYASVKALDARKGLVWLEPSKVNNTYALAMRRADAETKRIATISDLAAKARAGERFMLASNVEFYQRPDGLGPLQLAYDFDFGPENVVRMETGAVYEALRASTRFDAGVVFATDGRVPALDLRLLEDDRRFFPSYILAPVVRQATLDRHPEIRAPLEALAARLDNATMAGLNAAVDVQKRTVEDVASEFLRSAGLVSKEARP